MPFPPHSNESLQNFFDLANIFWPRLVAAIACGGIIGLENQIFGKSAGLRTCLMLSISCCIITLISIETAIVYGGEPGRISAQIITGIGFIGAGVIIRQGGKIAGITTASTIFLTAGLGITAGSGFIYTSVAVSALAALLLTLLKPVDYFIDNYPPIIRLRAHSRAILRAKKRQEKTAIVASVVETKPEL